MMISEILQQEDTEDYRDHISTVDQEGKRIWLYPKKPSGRFYRARTVVSVVFLAIFLSLPFIKVAGEPLLLFNILERKFILFGLLFTPQDFHLFVLAMLTFIVFIILFTVVFGRLFCGWVCPQTVFMEMFFRKIEYLIEGDASQQRKLEKAPWTTAKIQKRVLKHSIFFTISVIVSNFFLAYIIGMDQVIHIMQAPLEKHFGGFTAMLIFSGLFYGVFARLREQVCTTICPYGRLQSVLLVKDSIVVAYDHVRGEPRGKLKSTDSTRQAAHRAVFTAGDATHLADGDPVRRIQTSVAGSSAESAPSYALKASAGKGDCIDCNLCVAVCPTGIDIRNGTQLECTNCTACIDACDKVMDKLSWPRGLIRYDSMTGIETGGRKIFTGRVYAYSGVLLALLVLNIFLLSRRGIVETIILRSPGQLYQQKDETHLTNLYTYMIINKSTKDLNIKFQATTPGEEIKFVGQDPTRLLKGGKIEGAFFVEMPSDLLNGRKTHIHIDILADGKKVDEVETNFMGPGK